MISRGDENLYHQSLSTTCQLTLFVHYHIHNPYTPLEMRNWCTLFACVSSSLGNLPTTYIVANFVKGRTAGLPHSAKFEVRNT